MHRFDEIRCFENSEEETGSERIYDEEDDKWGEGCCEDELMDDDFYEREYCD